MSVGQNNPTRMELIKLKNKLQMSRRGHKLLKDKQDELIHRFVAIVHETRDLRVEIDNTMPYVFESFNVIKQKRSLTDIYEMLMIPSDKIKAKYDSISIMAVNVPKITLEPVKQTKIKTFSDLTAPIEIDIITKEMEGILPKIIKLAELEQQVRLMADEVEKLRRRVNVIEHVMIPELLTEIKRITMKLEDNERSNTVRIMKSKEIVIEKIMKDRENRNK